MRLEPVIAGLLFTLVSTAATNPAAVTFTKDVAPDSLVAGVPATVKKSSKQS
jgi:acetyltransferase-like isoleucine patch superfamily enzyme